MSDNGDLREAEGGLTKPIHCPEDASRTDVIERDEEADSEQVVSLGACTHYRLLITG